MAWQSINWKEGFSTNLVNIIRTIKEETKIGESSTTIDTVQRLNEEGTEINLELKDALLPEEGVKKQVVPFMFNLYFANCEEIISKNEMISKIYLGVRDYEQVALLGYKMGPKESAHPLETLPFDIIQWFGFQNDVVNLRSNTPLNEQTQFPLNMLNNNPLEKIEPKIINDNFKFITPNLGEQYIRLIQQQVDRCNIPVLNSFSIIRHQLSKLTNYQEK